MIFAQLDTAEQQQAAIQLVGILGYVAASETYLKRLESSV